GGDGGAIRRARPDVSGAECAGCGDSRQFRRDPGGQCRFVCGHRGRQCDRGRIGKVFAVDFGALPPEVSSGLMYTGPGSGSMLAPAAAWDGLAKVMDSAAVAYGSVIAGLTLESWLGPASASMAAAAAPYAGWLGAAAGLAQQTATQARTAAAAFEAAFAM